METEKELRAEIRRLRARVRELEANEAWDEEQIAAFLGPERIVVRSWCARNGVERATMARAADVRAAKARMPGQGHRRDLKGA